MKDEGKMNRAEADVHKHRQVETRMGGSHGRGSDVGNETRAETARTQLGGSRAEGAGEVLHMGGGLKGAVEELHSQHPHHHHDHGPHHGTTEHIRHKPLHGMKPGGEM